MQEIWNTDVSKIVHDTENNIVIKTVKRKALTTEWFNLYKDLQNRTPHIVKIIDLIDDYTYTMEYIKGIETDLYNLLDPYKGSPMTKTDYIRLVKAINHTQIASMALSNELPGKKFFVNQDAQLKNVAVIKNKNGYHFKYLDADSWNAEKGFYGVEGFYTAQFKIVFSTQRALA